MKPKKLITLGSYHTDYFLIGDRIPDKGETVTGNYYFTEGGGKGSNHACACSILGGNVVLIQKLGKDEGGETACRDFAKYGLSLDYVKMVEGEKTGLAPIMIDKDGNNSIMVFPGAHGRYNKEDIDEADKEFEDAFMMSFVFETNMDIVEYAIKKAYEKHVDVFLDPAPVTAFNPELYPYLTWIKPNEHEATLYTGIEVIDYDSAIKAGKWFLERGVKNALITLGERGSVLVTHDLIKTFPAPKIKAVDTTTAGDVFAGAFIYALSVEMPLEDAVLFASCAGALTTTKAGAVKSAPSFDEVSALLRQFKMEL